MKNLHPRMLVATLCLALSLSNCYQTKRTFDGMFTPNCKLFSVGSVCFHNPEGKAAKVEIDDMKMEVLPFSTLCVDMYEGDYRYKVKNHEAKWQDDLTIASCRERKVQLKRCEDC